MKTVIVGPSGLRVVERDDVLALGQDRAGGAVGDGQGSPSYRIRPSRSAAIDFSTRRARVSGLFVPVTWRACQLLFE